MWIYMLVISEWQQKNKKMFMTLSALEHIYIYISVPFYASRSFQILHIGPLPLVKGQVSNIFKARLAISVTLQS